MPSICFYFQVHQPYRLRHYTFFDLGASPFYEDEDANCDILLKVARKCYLPMNDLLYQLIRRYGDQFKVSFSISGTALDQFEEFAPEVLASFRTLAATGCVEFLAETYYHSLAFLFSPQEFMEQVAYHRKRIRELFDQEPKVFRNTELIYNNDLAREVEAMGFEAVLAEGADHVLGWRSPNFLYQPPGSDKLKILLKNYALSDDIAFRFSNQGWGQYPLTADKFASWLHSVNGQGEVVNLFMDYETFGEHQWANSGIFDFMRALPEAVLRHPDFRFQTPSEVAESMAPKAKLNVPDFMSWADAERDLTAWLGNDMQQDAIQALYRLEGPIQTLGNPGMTKAWRRLQTSDHFYYMSTKWFSDGDVHKYFNPYGSPYDAYINFMNVLADFKLRLDPLAQSQELVTESKPAPPLAESAPPPEKKNSKRAPKKAESGPTGKSPSTLLKDSEKKPSPKSKSKSKKSKADTPSPLSKPKAAASKSVIEVAKDKPAAGAKSATTRKKAQKAE